MEIRRYRGDTYAQRITITDANKQPVDITGWALALTVDPDHAPTSADNNLGVFAGALVDAANGIVEFEPNGIPAGSWWYDVQATDAAGNVRTVIKDRFIVDQDITKETSGLDSFDGGSATVQGNDVFNGGGA